MYCPATRCSAKARRLRATFHRFSALHVTPAPARGIKRRMRPFLPGLLSCLIASAACAQSFEVASVKPNRGGGENTGIRLLPGGRISVRNATLKTLIRNAWGILSFQLGGEAPWMDSEYFDIEAKTGEGQTLTEAQLQPWLRALLAERFHLAVHWEKRPGEVFALIEDRSGLKLRPNTQGGEPSMTSSRANGHVRMKAVGVPLTMLASNLANQLGRPVLDQTALPGFWDFEGAWNLSPPPDSPEPSVFAALKEQLGLRLIPQKGFIDILVVDHAERPSEN